MVSPPQMSSIMSSTYTSSSSGEISCSDLEFDQFNSAYIKTRIVNTKLSLAELFEYVTTLQVFYTLTTILTTELIAVTKKLAINPSEADLKQLDLIGHNQDLLVKVFACLLYDDRENNEQHDQEKQVPPPSEEIKKSPKCHKIDQRKPLSWIVPLNSTWETKTDDISKTKDKNSLQRAFETKCPKVLESLELRAGKINAKSEIRRRTAEIRRQRALHEYTLGRAIEEEQKRRKLILSVKTVQPREQVTEKEMRHRSAKIYSSLPEIESKREQQKKEQESRRHRMVSQIFSQRLKSQALKGHVSLPISERISCW